MTTRQYYCPPPPPPPPDPGDMVAVREAIEAGRKLGMKKADAERLLAAIPADDGDVDWCDAGSILRGMMRRRR